MGNFYNFGKKGLQTDMEEAFRWYKRGAGAGYAQSRARLGECYFHSNGVAKNESFGLVNLTSAAERGSWLGCYFLANGFADGTCGLPKDADLATEWYQKMLAAPRAVGPDAKPAESHRATARDWLREHAA